MSKLLILKGLPGSGKSTWAKEYVTNNPNWIRINRDDLRNMRGKYWIPKQEDLITVWEDDLIVSAIQKGYSVILDATNLNDERNKTRIAHLSATVKFTTEYKFFDVPVEKCIENDLKRPNSVGAKVIKDMYNRYLKPTTVPYKQNLQLPPAYIFDLDGTLALIKDRNPYEWDKVIQDDLNMGVYNIYNILNNAGFNIVILSGRDGCCRKMTLDWLMMHNIQNAGLLMRAEGDTRPDSIVKKELFDTIQNTYNIMGVFDDRDSVVAMWRDIGLTCFQVNYGDF